MEIISNISGSFTLLGLVEMEMHKYPYFLFSTVIYVFILMMNGIIVLVVVKERTLHEPMYILIASLVLNEIFGSSSFFPKLIVDLITSSKTISHRECLIQILCISTFVLFEMGTFTVMAYDRYLAVCQPLQYASLMTNDKVLKIAATCWVTSFTCIFVAVLMGWNLPLCGDKINSVFCDNMSFIVLSCLDASVNRIYASAVTYVYFCMTISVTVFSYFRIFMVCLRVSKESRRKAFHTLVTHLLNFSIFLMGVFFVFLRYRLERVNLPLMVHVLLSVTPLVFPPLLNPLIYGIRTQALKIKVIYYLQKINEGPKWTTIQMK
ncbi:PREDICTED: olfactory receptor 2A12-like [Nanorana parkeri]|uniref:olfactory receptor 2A12-like n=1 Tax=Nanorana parkeri TaxID=125878 RepID=UPI000854124E|nr:PREDICTED: olfactory receptor 2A12-like [Nanorana parkeri]